MADNVTVNTGSGATIATDDVGGVHYQYFKLADGTADSSAKIGGDATNGLDVDVTRVQGTVTVDSELPAAAALADNTANPTAPAVASFPHVWDGATWDRVPGNSADGLLVNLGANNDITVGAALPAGTNNIGDVDIASIAAGDNNIGNVDIVTMPNVTIGTMANLAESLADDAAFTPATSRVMPAGFTFDDTLTDSVDEGDIGAARMSANRNIYMRIRDNAGNERGANVDASGNLNVIAGANSGVDIGDVTINNGTGANAVNIQDGGNSITVDGSVSISGTATVDSELPAAAALADNTANPTVPGVGSFPHVFDGTTWDRLPGTSADGALVNLGANNDIQGDVAHDTADSGNPVKVGAKAIAHGANPTAVTADDRTNLYANRHGILFTIGGHPNVVTLEAAYTAAQTDAAIITIATGSKIVVTQIQAVCDNANSVDVGLRVGFGTASTPTTTGVVLTHPGIAPGSGVSRGDGSGMLGIGADNEDLRITSEVPTGGSLRILVTYYTIDS